MEIERDAVGAYWPVPLPALDLERLKQVVKWVQVEAEKDRSEREWFQGHYFIQNPSWDCGTKACVAGKIALDDGCTPVMDMPQSNGDVIGSDVIDPEGRQTLANHYARMALGLTPAEANVLFSGENTADAVEKYAKKIAASRGMDW